MLHSTVFQVYTYQIMLYIVLSYMCDHYKVLLCHDILVSASMHGNTQIWACYWQGRHAIIVNCWTVRCCPLHSCYGTKHFTLGQTNSHNAEWWSASIIFASLMELCIDRVLGFVYCRTYSTHCLKLRDPTGDANSINSIVGQGAA
jgi:hypothetical protein